MRQLSESDLWYRVGQLKGQAVYTLVQRRLNVVKEVTDTAVI
ncbi:MAG: hypothetical protein V3U79_11910 [Dehalococcoidia bacterium]